MVRVLISGLLVHDSGKTWLGVSLARRFIDLGLKVGVFKPVAGHSAWHQYITVIESFRRGILVGEDIIKYANVVKDLDIEISNPIDILLAPLDMSRYVGVGIYSYLTDLENQLKQMILARISKCPEKSSQHFIFQENIINIPQPLRYELEKLAIRLNAVSHNIEDFVKILTSVDIEFELIKCLDIIDKGVDVVLVESFNNALAPFKKILEYIDVLLIVAPSTIAIYKKTEEVMKVVNKIVKTYSEKGFETSHLLSWLKPDTVKYIKPRINIDEYDEYIDQVINYLLQS